jgi:hypothetical protein
LIYFEATPVDNQVLKTSKTKEYAEFTFSKGRANIFQVHAYY